MENEYEFKTYLETPKSYELASEIDIKPPIKKTVRRKRKERLPPYIPFKSVYEETDMMRLTERQKIMAIKFQSAKTKLSSLFLAVNDITSLKSCNKNCIQDLKRIEEFITWHWIKTGNLKLVKEIIRVKKLLEVGKCLCSEEQILYKELLETLELQVP
ncbi:hypothetical protein GINT2_001368 [Glugoides intestinalis]